MIKNLGFGGALLVVGIAFIFGCSDNSTSPEKNSTPVISSFRIDRERVQSDTPIGVKCLATDEDGDLLSYSWEVTSGSLGLTSLPDSISWHTPEEQIGATIRVIVSDGISTVQDSINVLVCDDVTIVTGEIEVGHSRQDSIYVHFDWEQLNGTQFMKIERKVADSESNLFVEIATVPFEEREYIDRTLTTGQVYDYRFSGLYCGGETPFKTIRIDREWPEVIEQFPMDGERGVPANSAVSLLFSESIVPGLTNVEMTGASYNNNLSISYGEDNRRVRISLESGFYLNREHSCQVAIVDTAGNMAHLDLTFSTYLEKIEYSKEVIQVAYKIDEGVAVFLNTESMDVFSFVEKRFVQSYSLDFAPTRFARNPADGYWYVTSYDENNIHVIDLNAGVEIETLDVLIINPEDPIPAKNPKAIAFSENGVGFVLVQAEDQSLAYHSLEEIRRVEGNLQISYRPEFIPGSTPRLYLDSASLNQCVMFHGSYVYDDQVFNYNSEEDRIEYCGNEDYHLGIAVQGSPLKPFFVADEWVVNCDRTEKARIGQFLGHRLISTFSNEVGNPNDGLLIFNINPYFPNLTALRIEDGSWLNQVGVADGSSPASEIACMNGTLIYVMSDGAFVFDLVDLFPAE